MHLGDSVHTGPPMRLIHTADIHLDTCYATSRMAPDFGNCRRQGLREVFHAIVTRAAAWPADALLIAGDLFDLDRVRRDTIAFLQAEFEAVRPLPVLIAPGNRDPYVADSPYATAPWPNNVVIFDGPVWASRALKDGKLMVHGFGFDGAVAGANPFGKLHVTDDRDRVQVAVAHGAAEGLLPPGKAPCAPFKASAVALKGLAYLALGHLHAMTPVEGGADTIMYYSGSPEGHGFDELGLHYYLEVEIDEHGVRVTPKVSSRVIYAEYTIDCSAFDTIEQVVEALRAVGAQAERPQVARITLTGPCPSDLYINVPAVHGAAASAFEALQVISKIEPMDDFEELARENTCFGIFIRKMNEELRDAPDETRRQFAKRARELGLVAYRQRQPAICELDED